MKIDEVIGIVGKANQGLYGINPYAKKLKVKCECEKVEERKIKKVVC